MLLWEVCGMALTCWHSNMLHKQKQLDCKHIFKMQNSVYLVRGKFLLLIIVGNFASKWKHLPRFLRDYFKLRLFPSKLLPNAVLFFFLTSFDITHTYIINEFTIHSSAHTHAHTALQVCARHRCSSFLKNAKAGLMHSGAGPASSSKLNVKTNSCLISHPLQTIHTGAHQLHRNKMRS